MRYWLVSLVLILLVSCTTATPAPSTRVVAQGASATPTQPRPTLRPTIRPAATATALPTATPVPTPAPPRDVPALLDSFLPATLTVESADADPVVHDLPAEVLIINTEGTEPRRHLVLVDPQGTRLMSPTADLERLGWCGPSYDVFSPSAGWSPSGRYLIASCQTDGEALAPAILDVAQATWLAIRHDRRGMTPQQRAGDDALGVIDWLVPDEQAVIIHVRLTPDQRRSESVYVLDLREQRLERIADFDGSAGLVSMAIAPDQPQIAMVAQRAGEPIPGLYLWDGRPLLRHTPGATDNPFDRITPVFAQQIQQAGGPLPRYVIADDGGHIAIREPAGWRIYAADGTAGALFPEQSGVIAKSVTWAADGRHLWICQVEDQVGVQITRMDTAGQTATIARYPNVGLPNEACVAESPSGLLAFSLTNPLVVIVDAQHQEIGSVPGATEEWRPRP